MREVTGSRGRTAGPTSSRSGDISPSNPSILLTLANTSSILHSLLFVLQRSQSASLVTPAFLATCARRKHLVLPALPRDPDPARDGRGKSNVAPCR